MEVRHTGNLKIFSENASTNESSAFGTTTNTDNINTLLNTNFQVGWENGIDEDGFPLRKWFNGKDKAITKLIAYLFQQGTPKYDATQKYYVDSICVYNGKVYISLLGTEATPNVGNTPASSIGTSWNILNMNHLTGAISNILTSNLTENRALISDSSGKITVSSITSTILDYLANVSSDIQGQLNGKTPLNGSGASGTWDININGTAENLTIPTTTKLLGAWGVDIGGNGAILVNSAYIALIAMNALGYGQSWQNVTASRARDVIYTNTTGRTIVVSISIGHNSLSTRVDASVGGVLVAYGLSDASKVHQLIFEVPAGSTYYISTISGSPSVQNWSELR